MEMKTLKFLKQIEAGDRVSIKQYIKWLQSGARILISKVNTIKGFHVSGWKQHVVAGMGLLVQTNIQIVRKMFNNFRIHEMLTHQKW